jgi:hypothetical protein
MSFKKTVDLQENHTKKERPVFAPPKSGISIKAHIQSDFILRFH